jgi:hypothetical protein
MTAIDIHGSSWRRVSAACALLPQRTGRGTLGESAERHRFIRHPQVLAQATPCIQRKT